MDAPHLSIEDTGEVFTLDSEVTTVGRGDGIDVGLTDPTVSRLHAELVRRGPHLYVSDLGLSSNGTRVNGRPIGRRLLSEATSSRSAPRVAGWAACSAMRSTTSRPRFGAETPPTSPAASRRC